MILYKLLQEGISKNIKSVYAAHKIENKNNKTSSFKSAMTSKINLDKINKLKLNAKQLLRPTSIAKGLSKGFEKVTVTTAKAVESNPGKFLIGAGLSFGLYDAYRLSKEGE